MFPFLPTGSSLGFWLQGLQIRRHWNFACWSGSTFGRPRKRRRHSAHSAPIAAEVLVLEERIMLTAVVADGVDQEVTDPNGGQAPANATDAFLRGNFIEVGVHSAGSFGTSTRPPQDFHPTNFSLGFVADPHRDGFDQAPPGFTNQTGDYFLPGSPEEGWALEWTSPSGFERTFHNFGRMREQDIPRESLTAGIDGETVSAVWTGTAVSGTDAVHVTQTVSFNVNDLYFVISVRLENVGSTTLTDLEYMRNVDPDQEQPLFGGSFSTRNFVVDQPGVDGNEDRALVVAEGLRYGYTLGLGTINPNAVVSNEGFSNRDPDGILDSPVAPSPQFPSISDSAIALAYRFVSIAPGETITLDYVYVLNAEDLETALADVETRVDGDFGDAPDSYGTTLSRNGARHVIVEGFHLGNNIDADANGQPSADALGDDNDGDLAEDGVTPLPDDEDGVVIPNIVINADPSVLSGHVTASLGESAGFLDAWVDFDGSGTFDADEHIFSGVSKDLVEGFNEYTFTVPSLDDLGPGFDAFGDGDSFTSYARFRLSSTGGLAPTGAAVDGEVQDYAVTILKGTSASGVQQNIANIALRDVLSDPGLIIALSGGNPVVGDGVNNGDETTELINQKLITTIQQRFDELGVDVENVLMFWVDPVDMILTDSQGRQAGFQNGEAVNSFGSNAVVVGDGSFGVGLIVNADPSSINVQLAGVGAGAFRAGVNNITRTSVQSQTLSGSLPGGQNVALALDFGQSGGPAGDAIPVISLSQTSGPSNSAGEFVAFVSTDFAAGNFGAAESNTESSNSVDSENISRVETSEFLARLARIRHAVDQSVQTLIDGLEDSLSKVDPLELNAEQKESLRRLLRIAGERLDLEILGGAFGNVGPLLEHLFNAFESLFPSDDAGREPQTTETVSTETVDDADAVTESTTSAQGEPVSDGFNAELDRAIREAVDEILTTPSAAVHPHDHGPVDGRALVFDGMRTRSA